ncbi:hypothetical protein ENSA5_48690 [Enhygromyxa salina]|uniref:Glycosyltransferase RgtA/B/C/D-like domain-containing protein n=1 Tax=Enhygromyxa salina TaxID=215803 RepID=A0A2S9XIE1_9BACT|nr:hypothetical protein [Enhygromyxa salina]PRP92451.1 hypothetical protein ENSA5_48690 [Enhygromyxa salina]
MGKGPQRDAHRRLTRACGPTPSARAGSEVPGDRRKLERFGAVAFVLACAWLAWRTLARVAAAWSFTTDDAYITLRYARHLLAGDGLVWNLGEAPVEGYSNFAYVVIAAGFGALGELDAAPLKLLGCASLVAIAYLQWAIARRFVRPLPALLPFAFYSLQRGVIWWSVSGLETSVYVALCCGVVLACLRGLGFERVELDAGDGGGDSVGLARGPLRPRALAVAGGLCMLGSLLRPEGPLVAAAVGVGAGAQLWIDSRSDDRSFDGRGYRRAVLGFVGVFVPLMLAYAAWRHAYFGELLPNTVRCKTGHHDRFALLGAYWSAAPLTLVLALLWPLRSLDARVLLPIALAAVYALALVGADPLIGHDLRHFLAAHALLCVLAGVSATRLAAWVGRGIAARWVEPALLLAVLASASPLGGLPEREDLEARAKGYGARTRARAALGRYLAHELDPGERALLGDVGVAGWTGDAPILDAFCLNTPQFAEPPLRGDPSRAADWILDEQRPRVIVVHSRSAKKIAPRGKIYRELVDRERFKAGWREQRRFNSDSGQFHYVVFRRVD